MVLLAVALAGLLWERLDTVPYSLRAIPVGVLALSLLFAMYALTAATAGRSASSKDCCVGCRSMWAPRPPKSNWTSLAR